MKTPAPTRQPALSSTQSKSLKSSPFLKAEGLVYNSLKFNVSCNIQVSSFSKLTLTNHLNVPLHKPALNTDPVERKEKLYL